MSDKLQFVERLSQRSNACSTPGDNYVRRQSLLIVIIALARDIAAQEFILLYRATASCGCVDVVAVDLESSGSRINEH